MADMKRTANDIIRAMKEAGKKQPSAYDTTAEVKRVEGSTAWVHIPGGVDETPAALTIDAAVGDTVQIRVADGNAWITGNQTAPPTSDKTAKEALEMAAGAAKTVERGLVSDTLYYLASDQDSGVTVDTPGWSEEPQEITEALPYLWIYHLYTYADGRTETTEPCIAGVFGVDGQDGQDGQDGTDGVSVTSVTPQYYLSLSDTSATGGSWSNSLPSYVSGRFYWTRDKITYSNGTTGYSTATYSPGLTESVQLSYNTAQHFWTQPASSATTTIPSGAYVTEQTESAYKSNPTGGATLIRSDKVDIRVGSATYSRFDGDGTHIYDGNGIAASNVLAEFTGAGTTIGKSGNAQVKMDYRSMSMTDKNGNTFFEVKDLRDSTGTFSYTDTFKGDGTTRTFYLTFTATTTSYTVTVSDGSGGTKTKDTYRVVCSTAPTNGATITVTYTSAADYGKYYTLGTRDSSAGPMSVGTGADNNASGYCSFAGGYDGSVASGTASFAYGHATEASGNTAAALGEQTVAASPSQFVCGRFNKTDTNNKYAFIIGAGGMQGMATYDNAFTVGWTGGITAGGLPSGLLAEEVSIVDNLTVASGSYSDGTASVAKTGYTPIGIVGFRCVNASSSGAGGAQGVIQYAYLSGTNNATANYRVRNVASGLMKVRIYFTVLYALR